MSKTPALALPGTPETAAPQTAAKVNCEPFWYRWEILLPLVVILTVCARVLEVFHSFRTARTNTSH